MAGLEPMKVADAGIKNPGNATHVGKTNIFGIRKLLEKGEGDTFKKTGQYVTQKGTIATKLKGAWGMVNKYVDDTGKLVGRGVSGKGKIVLAAIGGLVGMAGLKKLVSSD